MGTFKFSPESSFLDFFLFLALLLAKYNSLHRVKVLSSSVDQTNHHLPLYQTCDSLNEEGFLYPKL